MGKARDEFGRIKRRLLRARADLAKPRRQALVTGGVQIISWAVQDYRERARGGTAGGISWRRLTRGAIRTRLSRFAAWKTERAKLASLRQQEAPILAELRRTLPRGAKYKANRGAIASKFAEDNKALKRIRKQRASIRAARNKRTDAMLAKHEIGVDTGRLVNSLVFGVPELAAVRVPKNAGEAPPKAEFKVADSTVTVGSNLVYAPAFDRLRPIFPPGFISKERQEKLDEIAVRIFRKHLRQVNG